MPGLHPLHRPPARPTARLCHPSCAVAVLGLDVWMSGTAHWSQTEALALRKTRPQGPTSRRRCRWACCCCSHSFSPAAARRSPTTRAIWAPASAERGGSPNFVLLRPPTLRLRTAPSRMTVLVSAAPDAINQGQLLGRYRLFVNGVYVAVSDFPTHRDVHGVGKLRQQHSVWHSRARHS